VPNDPLYDFVVEKQPARSRKPWYLLAAMTLILPASVLVASHWLVAQDLFNKQGAIVLLFFGWITGAQLIFVTYRMRTKNFARLFTMIVFSFIIVVVGYTLISHAFELFLYPDESFSKRMYLAAGIDVFWFDVLVVLVTAVIVLGWVRTYYSERKSSRMQKVIKPMWLWFYALISREFYVIDLYVWLVRRLDRLATRLNVWLRWV